VARAHFDSVLAAEGEVRIMTTALSRTGVDAAQVDYVSAHATGTPAGDDAELAALDRVFGPGPPAVGQPDEGASRSLLQYRRNGKAVATVIQLRGGFGHPNPTFTDPVDTSLRLVGSSPVRAPLTHGLSNAFGFGGFTRSMLLTRT
jgi:malonyl-ACP decarboxylase